MLTKDNDSYEHWCLCRLLCTKLADFINEVLFHRGPEYNIINNWRIYFLCFWQKQLDLSYNLWLKTPWEALQRRLTPSGNLSNPIMQSVMQLYPNKCQCAVHVPLNVFTHRTLLFVLKLLVCNPTKNSSFTVCVLSECSPQTGGHDAKSCAVWLWLGCMCGCYGCLPSCWITALFNHTVVSLFGSHSYILCMLSG